MINDSNLSNNSSSEKISSYIKMLNTHHCVLVTHNSFTEQRSSINVQQCGNL